MGLPNYEHKQWRSINISLPELNGRRCANIIYKYILLNENDILFNLL